ncbi:MAG: OmpA family protein, partial [Bacteroidota bacterium]
IVNKGSTQNGAASIISQFKDLGINGHRLANLTDLLAGGDQTDKFMNTGNLLMDFFMGGKKSGLLSSLASLAGFSGKSSSSLLSLLAPIVTSQLGKLIVDRDLNATGLSDLLGAQKSFLKSALPASLAGTLGFADNVKEQVTETVNTVREEASSGGSGFLKWLIPLLLIGGLLYFFKDSIFGGGEKMEEDKVEINTEYVNDDGTIKSIEGYLIDENGNLIGPDGAIIKGEGEFDFDAEGNITDRSGTIIVPLESDIDMEVESDGSDANTSTMSDEEFEALEELYVDDDGNLVNSAGEVVLPAGEFTVTDDGVYIDKDGNVLGRILGKIRDAIVNAAEKTADVFKNTFSDLFSKAEGASYTLTQIEFDPESQRISNFSKAEVEGLAAALQANTDAKIQVQAYTADGDSKARNNGLSSMRADVVKNMLVTLGVDAKQISSKGMASKDEAKASENKVEIIVK